MNKSANYLKLMRNIVSESIWHLGGGEEMFLVSECTVVDVTTKNQHGVLTHPKEKARSAQS